MRSHNIVPSLFLDFMQMQEFARQPLVFAKGDGIAPDRQPRASEYIDGLSGVFVASVGHDNRAVIEAITEQLNRLAFAPPLHGTNPAALDLTELLLRIAPRRAHRGEAAERRIGGDRGRDEAGPAVS